jgi:hypothetical protein
MFLGMVYLFVSMNSTSQTGSSICSREKTNYMLYIEASMLVNYPMSKKYYARCTAFARPTVECQ